MYIAMIPIFSWIYKYQSFRWSGTCPGTV